MSAQWKTAALACVLLLALACSLAVASRFRDLPHLGYTHDDTLYLESAKSLAEGHGHRISSSPYPLFQTKYPPLYPLILAPVMKIYPRFPAEPGVMWLYLWLMLPCFGIASWFLFRSEGIPPTARMVLTILVVLNPYLVFLSLTPMTELVLGAVIITICVALKNRHGSLVSLSAGVLGGLGFLIRSAALPLLIAAPLWQLSRKRFRDAAVFFLAMAPFVVGWMWWSAAHRAPAIDLTTLYYTDYLGFYLATAPWRDLHLVLWMNIDAMMLGIGRLVVFDLNDSGIPKVLMQTLAAGAIAGIVRMVRERGWSPFTAVAVASLPMLLFWNFQPNERFLAGFTPLFLLGAFREGSHIFNMARANLRSAGKGERLSAKLLLGALAIFSVFGVWRELYGTTVYFPAALHSFRAAAAERRAAFQFISGHTAPDASFATTYDGLLYLFTGRSGFRMTCNPILRYRNDTAQLRAYYSGITKFARLHKLNHIMFTPGDFSPELTAAEYREIVDSVSRDASWEAIYRSGDVSIFRDRNAPR